MSEQNDDLWLFQSYSDETDVQAVAEVIRRGTWWAKGDEIDEFESEIANRAGTEHGLAFNSGTSAAFSVMEAIGIEDKEVIVPSFTFSATANVVVAAGGIPVFADIERESLSLAPDSVREKLNDKTAAIMPIHFAGDICADIHGLKAIADNQGIPLIEDAAHSLGATLNGDSVGSFGDAAMFSFCFNKVLTTGEGGMIVTDDSNLRDELELIRSHGRNQAKEYVTYGHNFRMSSMTAALGVSQVAKLDEMIAERRRMAEYLNDGLADITGVQVPRFPSNRDRVYQLYNLRIDEQGVQADLQEHLNEQGISTRVTYNPVHLTKYYREQWGYQPGDLPVTEAVSNEILTLPFHLYLSDQDLDRIIEGVRTFFSDGT